VTCALGFTHSVVSHSQIHVRWPLAISTERHCKHCSSCDRTSTPPPAVIYRLASACAVTVRRRMRAVTVRRTTHAFLHLAVD